MLGICLTALPLSFIGDQVLLLLLLVAILSGYLAFAGWREAVRPRSSYAWADRTASIIMIVAAATMLAWGALALVRGKSGGIVLLLFGVIGMLLAVNDLRRIAHPAVGADRIAVHMARMMGAMIAVITAFLVVNVRFSPSWVIWIAPTMVLTPLIALWSKRVRAAAAT